jgi:hypothetical protein
MYRYLVVANQTLFSGALTSKIQELHAAGAAAFHVLVPATPPGDHPWTDAEARALAQRRLDDCLERFRGAGFTVDGEVGDEHPVDAIKDVLDRDSFSTIVLSTLKPGVSRWLGLDLVSRVTGFGIPVIHVIGEREPAHT